MPSTYTANNGIEKIGTGEQSGTWGATTNTNFDIIDRALNGVTTIALAGTSHTLTTTDGSLSDGHYRVLVLGGSPTGTNTITISPNDQSKVYVVYNNSGQDVIFTQGTGGNVTIGNGASATVYADGAGAGAQVRQVPADLVYDTSPQLGGDLDLNSNDITGTGNIDITGDITASGTVSTADATATGAVSVSGASATLKLEANHPTGTSNIAIGNNAYDADAGSASYNVGIGEDVLSGTSPGDRNIAIGYQALENVTDAASAGVDGSDNIAIGYQALDALTSGEKSVAIGSNALGAVTFADDNVAIGHNAGALTGSTGLVIIGSEAGSQDTVGTGNTLVGYQAGEQLDSSMTYNVAVGFQTMDANSFGSPSYNVGIGYQAFRSGYGDYNVCIGYSAGNGTVAGERNVYMGYQAGFLSSGDDNVAIGYRALQDSLSSGDSNVAVGRDALLDCSTGYSNVAIGPGAGDNVTSGNQSTYIGNGSGGANQTGTNNVCIGNLAGGSSNKVLSSSDSNQVVIGNGSITNAYIQVAWTVASDTRDKTNIGEVPHGLDFVTKVTPISFQYRESRDTDQASGPMRYGYSAQDVLAAEGDNPVLVDNTDPEYLKLTETNMIPVLHNAIKELYAENQALKARLDAAGL